MAKVIAFAIVIMAQLSCGVRGDPVPPGTPAELGRGQPTYKRAAEEFAMPEIPPLQDEDREKKKARE